MKRLAAKCVVGMFVGAALSAPLAAGQDQAVQWPKMPPSQPARLSPPPPITIAPDSSLPRDARTRNEREWAGQIQQNYPSTALRQEIQGSVGVHVIVNDLGRVSQCMVTSSSGHAILDEAACSGMVRFATFDPALDADGNAIEGSYSTRITYRLNNSNGMQFFTLWAGAKNESEWAEQVQQEFSAEALRFDLEGSVVVVVRVNDEGGVADCRVASSSGQQKLDDAACAGMSKYAEFIPLLDKKDEPTSGLYVRRITHPAQ